MPLFGPPNIEKLKEKVDLEGPIEGLTAHARAIERRLERG